MSAFDDPGLLAARDASSAATSNAGAVASSAQTMPDILRETLTKKFTSSNPLYADRESALKNYLTTTTQAPLDYTAKSAGGNSDVIYNPLQQANLIQARKAGALAPLSTANSKLALGAGGIQDIIDSATRAYGGIVAGAQGNATNKRQTYEDLLKEAGMRSDEAYKNASLAASYASKNNTNSLQNLFKIYDEMKPSDKAQGLATNAQSGLDAVATIRSLMAKNPNILMDSKNPVLGLFNKDVQSFNSAKTEAVDILTRIRTGAALNKDEQKTYDSLFSAFNKNEVTNQNLDRLEKLYTSTVQKGTKTNILDFLNQAGYGGDTGGGSWEIVQ